ncbi:MAG: aldo/keto reductase [Firmicutes bacterium]|nr:aldo/keto reductase [Bacillota bacterium]
MKQIKMGGRLVPILGQGGWEIGENPDKRAQEIAALRFGIEHGMTLLDTAEMYGQGRSELLMGEVIKCYERERLYVVSKVLPSSVQKGDLIRSCTDSLRRLGVEYLDLYLLHWRGEVVLERFLEGVQELKHKQYIKDFGVSNFDTEDMRQLCALQKGGNACVCNQVLYHIGSRGIEWELEPYCKEVGSVTMAYCPLALGGKLSRWAWESGVLQGIANKHGVALSTIMLAFVLRNGERIAIPKSTNLDHIKQNLQATQVVLDADDLLVIDKVFCPPSRKMPLDFE